MESLNLKPIEKAKISCARKMNRNRAPSFACAGDGALVIINSVFLSETDAIEQQANTTISSSFTIEGVEEVKKIIITAKENESGSEPLQRTSTLHVFDIFIKKANFFAKVLDKNRKSGIL